MAKIGQFYWRPTNSIGARSVILVFTILESFLVYTLLVEILIRLSIRPQLQSFDRRSMRVFHFLYLSPGQT
jgi:hypothetical protein